jgi:hypothetical protein
MDVSARDLLTALAVLVSLGALGLGLINFQRAKRLDERDLFLKVHERLIEPDVVAGRRILYTLRSKEEAAALAYREEEMTKVYRALAMFDILALYAEQGWINEDTVLDEWGNSLRNSIRPAAHFIAARYDSVQWHSWPHYRALAAKAERAPTNRQ